MEEVKNIDNEVLELYGNYQINDSKNLLEILDLEIKICNLVLNTLEIQKPLWFQRKKIKIYQSKKENLERKIINLKTLKNEELLYISSILDK